MERLLAHPYIRLMRLDKPTGFLLLMWPCGWSVMLACHALGNREIPWRLLLLFAIGAVTMRAAGCIINDMTDRDLDRQVERTRNRPLASGEVSMRQAALLLFALLGLSLLIALLLGPAIVFLSALWLLPIVLYPWMKRITWWPQAFLGLTFNAGALFGWVAVAGKLAWPPLLLYLGAIGWTLGYDTIYAHQDKRDDRRLGIKSTALRLGDHSKRWIGLFYGIFLAALMAVGIGIGAGSYFHAVLLLVGMHLAWQVWRVDVDDRTSCWQVFRSNILTGLLVFAACCLA